MTQRLDLNSLVPGALKNETLTSLVSNLFNRFVSEEQSVMVAGRIGKIDNQSDEAVITANDLDHTLNALVPAIQYKAGTEQTVVTFSDVLNKLEALSVNTDELKTWMAEQSFNLAPPIDLDKFSNYTNYYWLPSFLVSSEFRNKMVWNPDFLPEYYSIARPAYTSEEKLPVRVATTRDIKLHGADRVSHLNGSSEDFVISFLNVTDFTITSSEAPTPFKIKIDSGAIQPGPGLTGAPPYYSLPSAVAGTKTKISIYALDLLTDPESGDYGIGDTNPAEDLICTFYITVGTNAFALGDVFTVTVTYFTSENYAAFTTPGVASGKGAIDGIVSKAPFMLIDGVRLRTGDRVLVWQQINPAENGIYRVTGKAWSRSPGTGLESYMPVGAKIYVDYGTTHAGKTFTLTSKVSLGTLPNDELNSELTFTPSATTGANFINDWQLYNFWYHRDFIVNDIGISLEYCTQATRPIIEFAEGMQLNEYANSGIPSDAGTYVPQTKIRFNQIPQFDLFRYDGTHAGKTSGIFFYVEDQDYPVDTHLQIRAKTTTNSDYVFGLGIKDESNRLLFFKNPDISSIWAAGPNAPTYGTIYFDGPADKGTISITDIKVDADNQQWAITAVDATTFRVVGSRHGNLTATSLAVVGTPFDCDDFTLTVSAGIQPFAAGESFTFAMRNRIAPRYVQKLDDGSVVNYPGGSTTPPENDRLDNGEVTGIWLTPLRMFQNLDRELNTQINFADMANHLRSIIKNQDGFEGSSFGNNNYRELSINLGYGGQIREFGSNLPLLLSMLAQQQMSPLSILDFAETQYNFALFDVDTFSYSEVAKFFSDTAAIIIDPSDPDPSDDANIQLFLDAYEARRATDENLRLIFSDTTAAVTYWPLTLPMARIIPAVVPEFGFDNELGLDVIIHHDNHRSPKAVDSLEVSRAVVTAHVLRSDGTSTPGIFSATAPAGAYARQIWMHNSTQQLYVFNVVSDGDDVPPAGTAGGQFWYKKSTAEVYEWDTGTLAWVLSATPSTELWEPFSVAAIRNAMILAVENRLYDGIHVEQLASPPVIDVNAAAEANPEQMEVELARFAAKYQYDVFGADFNINDAFTWNYDQAIYSDVNVAAILGATPSIARWQNIYKAYFDQPGVSYPTCRPNLEPWKLLNHETEPAWWATTYAAATTVANINEAYRFQAVRACADADITLMGLQTIDTISLNEGDRVLVANQISNVLNGIYLAHSGAWTRTSDLPPLSLLGVNDPTDAAGMVIDVLEGERRGGTTWLLRSLNPVNVGTSAIIFEQARLWKDVMWDDIKTANPTMKLCVNRFTDALLPPYVSPAISSQISGEALLNIIPPGIDGTYEFGDDGIVELVWKKSLEYYYGAARTYFKTSPLEFLDKTWGETYLHAFNKNSTSPSPIEYRVERNLQNALPASKFLLHGDKLNLPNSMSSSAADACVDLVVGGTDDITLEFVVAYIADDVTVFDAYVNGVRTGWYFKEGEPADSISGAPAVVGFEDNGIAFNLGDKFAYTRISLVESLSFVGAAVKKLVGFGQLFTNTLRHSSIGTEMSTAISAYNGWATRLVHRFGALIKQDTLSINTSVGALPTTAFNVLLKRSSNVDSRWISAIRIQLVEKGARKLNEFGLDVPRTDGSDWKFRVEAYNNQHPTVDYYELDTSANYQTFFALQKESTDIEWKHFTEVTSLIENAAMPKIITGVQNVINFMFGYTRRLEELGFFINLNEKIITDAETGRNLDWQLEIEKFVDRVFSGIQQGKGHILNPFMNALWLDTPIGIMSPYSAGANTDIYVAQAAYDVNGNAIPINKLNVIRTDENTVTYSSVPLFSAHLFTDEYDHIIVFNNNVSDEYDSSIIFSSFLGLAINSAYLTYTRQETFNGKPTFNGFFLNGNNVQRNITSSIDNIAHYYDAANPSDEEVSKHALALLGFTQKDYFNNLNISDLAQFNFWRGLIQAKGTNMTIDTFVNYKKFNDASTDEYWAYKLAEYGDARERTSPEIKINSSDCTQSFTQFQFYDDTVGLDAIPLYTAIENNDDTRWYSIDDLAKGLKFEAEQLSETFAVTTATVDAPVYVKLQNIYHNGDASALMSVTGSGATIINANLVKVTVPGTYTVSGYTWLNPTKFSPVKLFDYVSNTLVDEVPLWHPAIGIHPGQSLEAVNIITAYDPAQYNYSVQTVDNPNYALLKPWGQKEVGRTWWDTRNLGYIPYYDAAIFTDRQARQARWGKLAEWASIDLYEWVESSVPPSEYDAKAAQEEGRTDIPVEIRASGKAALKTYYKRDRTIQHRVIAWSRAGVGAAIAHPAFGSAEFTKILNFGNALFPDFGRVSAVQFEAGRHFGGWRLGQSTLFIEDAPVGDVVFTGTTIYNIGGVDAIDAPTIDTSVLFSAVPVDLGNENLGKFIGAITLSRRDENLITYLRMSDTDGNYEDYELSDWIGAEGQIKNIDFTNFGIRLKMVKNTSLDVLAADIADALTLGANDIYIREGQEFTTIVALPEQLEFINDETDPFYSYDNYEWRCWANPTQDELDADIAYPHNQWKPYYGDWTTVTATSTVAEEMSSEEASLILVDGTIANSYQSLWSDWEKMSNVKIEKISNGTDVVSFLKSEFISSDIEVLNLNRLQVFVNGAQLTPNTAYGYKVGFDVDANEEMVYLINAIPEGSTVLLVYLKYQPTSTELSFDPETADDFTKQVNYKEDYQYSFVDVKNEYGQTIETNYYFWVMNKSIPAKNKTVSITQCATALQNGPSTFMLLSRLMQDGSSASYDSCAIAGLGRYVTKNDTYKLRFLRNFTLRDDPNQLQLKNVHTEWTLLRRNQQFKIPEQLWNLITDAAAGTDISGAPIPSAARVAYDLRNGTRTSYGFNQGQIFAPTELVRTSIVNTILNTTVTIKVGNQTITDYLTALDFSQSDNWFATAELARATMSIIWATGRAKQINEIFFAILDDALSSNFEFSDLFKTSFITVNSSTPIIPATQNEVDDEIF